jgi:hypothetical protein
MAADKAKAASDQPMSANKTLNLDKDGSATLAPVLCLVPSWITDYGRGPDQENLMMEISRTDCGVSAVWVFANLSFTAMRAQGKGRIFWKVLTFIFGFPGTLLTLFVVTEGGERAYGIDMPRKSGTQ